MADTIAFADFDRKTGARLNVTDVRRGLVTVISVCLCNELPTADGSSAADQRYRRQRYDIQSDT